MDNRRHVSENERKKDMLIYILAGIIIAIAVIIIIIMIPKGNNSEGQEGEYLTSKVSENLTRTQNKTVEVKRDTNRVRIRVFNVTPISASIEITDKNKNQYEWYPNYFLEREVDGEWKEVNLINQIGMSFKQVQLKANSEGTISQSIAWNDKYGELEAGKYRVEKEANGVKFYGEFEITKNMVEAYDKEKEEADILPDETEDELLELENEMENNTTNDIENDTENDIENEVEDDVERVELY